MNHEDGQPARTQAPPEAAGGNGVVDESDNVDRIRNILFGSQMREYDGRFRKLEERLAREAGELRADLQKRLEALEGFMKGEVESMTHRLQGEKEERGQKIEHLVHELAETAKGLEQKIRGLDGQTATELRDLRHHLLEQSKAFGAQNTEKS